jgi:hypothetical protein
MKQVPSDKYNVAWFKLADCIARGEKERALGVYRLLAHSLDDPALSLQLHGDILLSFQDTAAHAKYKQAAQLYHERHKLLEAAAVYEHLALLEPHVIDIRIALIDIYQQLAISSKVCLYVEVVLAHFLAQKNWVKAIDVVDTYESAGDHNFAGRLYEALVMAMIPTREVLFDTKVILARKAVDAWHQADNKQALNEFMKKLEHADEKLCLKVMEYQEL